MEAWIKIGKLYTYLVGRADMDSYRYCRCMKMAIVHDLAESFVGDITPHDGVSDKDKHKMEKVCV